MDPAAKRKRDARTQPTVGAKAPATTDYTTPTIKEIYPRVMYVIVAEEKRSRHQCGGSMGENFNELHDS